MNNKKLRKMILIAMLGSIATVLMQFNFPLPALPGFLKIDFSEIPAVLAIMTMGPVAGIAVELLKNIMHWFMSGSPTGVPVGEIANFATGVLFIMPIYFIFNKFKTSKGLSWWPHCWNSLDGYRHECLELFTVFTDVYVFHEFPSHGRE